MQEITQFISSVGFPIAASCGLFWFANKLVDRITSVISDNTVAINKLITMISGDDNAVDL